MAQSNSTFKTSIGDVKLTLIGHGSVMIEFDNKIIQVDPYSEVADYSQLPKADLILITHEHYDHLDTNAIDKTKKENTKIISTPVVKRSLKDKVTALSNRESIKWDNVIIEAVEAYNIEHKNDKGELFHPKGRGNGYLLKFGDFVLYIAGDTEVIPEMKNLRTIDVAFMPKNLPYTMSDSMFIEAAKIVKPKVLFPYHYFELNLEELQKALPDIELRK